MLKNILGKKCTKGYELQIMSCGAGKYVGTTDEYGFPNCRATEYFESVSDLEKAPLQFRSCMENNYCHGGCGCLNAD